MTIHPIPLTHEHVRKAWGGELIICNNTEFCGKILTFKQGAQFSCHWHRLKREVFHVLEGCVHLMTIDPETAKQSTLVLIPGDSIEIPRFLPHQITAVSDARVIEFSTEHHDSDSYRMFPGDSQRAATLSTP